MTGRPAERTLPAAPPAPQRPASARRADIQGLRAVAVGSVVAFHAGLPLPGGFVGVDVFFVISGFVITAMLQRERLRTGTVRLGQFYLRRFRRLTPALVTVVAVVLVLSGLFLSPVPRPSPGGTELSPQQAVAVTALGAMALCANWVIATVTGGYFGLAAATDPLLHTWSLSVEEQFYLVFPTLLILAWLLGRRRRRAGWAAVAAVLALTIASLAMIRGASFGIPAESWVLGFFSPFNRAWEFGVGALLALTVHRLRLRTVGLATAVGVVGAVLVLVALFRIDEETPFPGKWTLVPVVGAALLLWAGSTENGPVARLLGWRPLARVGDWSYSIYLWHWPLIVFAGVLFRGSPVAVLVAAAVSVPVAVASYHLIEVPFRTTPRWSNAQAGARVAAMVAATCALAVAAYAVADQVLAPAFRTGTIAAAHPAPAPRPGEHGVPCEVPEVTALIGDNGACLQSLAGRPIEVLLLGDSHAEHLLPGLANAFPTVNVGLFAYRSPKMFGTPQTLSHVLDAVVASPSIRTVVVSRYWDRRGLRETQEREPLVQVVERLSAAGKTVLVADDVPDYPFDAFQCQYRIGPAVPASRCTEATEVFMAGHERYLRDLRDVVRGTPGVSILELARYGCDARECSMILGGALGYKDKDHLNPSGSRFVVDAALRGGPQLAEALGPR